MGRVMVTGGAGYVGSAVVRRLLSAGHEVVIFDKMLRGCPVARAMPSDRLSLFRGDVRDEGALDAAMQGVDTVIHLAAIVGIAACDSVGRATAEEVNVKGTRLVCEAARRWGAFVIFASTCSVYSAATDASALIVHDGSQVVEGNSTYTITKIAAEQIATETGAAIYRFGTAYGLSVNMRFDLMINEWTRDLVLDGYLQIRGPQAQRPFAHVTSIANTLANAVEEIEEKQGRAACFWHDYEHVVDFNISKLELARVINGVLGGRCELDVVDMDDWGYMALASARRPWLRMLRNEVSDLAGMITSGVWTQDELNAGTWRLS